MRSSRDGLSRQRNALAAWRARGAGRAADSDVRAPRAVFRHGMPVAQEPTRREAAGQCRARHLREPSGYGGVTE
jgi:hypothetical protein